MPQLPSLLGVFGHPDDESLVAGGVLAQHAESGARIGVATATWAPGTRRAAELADATRILGAGEPRLLGYADHRVADSSTGPRLCDAPLERVVEDVVRQIREFRPEIVLTHDAYGGLTGHPDHRLTHRAVVLAATAAGLGHLYPDAGAPWRPSALHLATHPHSAIADLGPLLTRVGKAVLSVPDESVDLALDVHPWLDTKWAAICAHRSQVDRERPLPGLLARLPLDVREQIIGREYFTRIDLRPVLARPA
ncbi:PIG-L deacetylase family protein [Kitasatospora aureofaciens]|uniref:PIG-L deacetylase family protein n=1 Tax=Kitasatospora aureofaciens TaxID=1894 RepID=UPI0037C96FF1